MSSRRNHRGLTLFEILLVLTLLVVLGALSMPALEGAFAHSRLRHAGDELRAVWTSARVASLQTGQTHVFRCVWGSGQYHVQALNVLVPSVDGQLEPLPDVAITTDEEVEDADWVENRLTGGVTFSTGTWSSPFEQQTTMLDPNNAVSPGEWSRAVYFFPDGTTSDATLILENLQEARLRITLRGLTGISLASDADLDEEM